ncbi:putative P-loop containing nucleoside triphosphate hydrolase, leucine-rich repeat domain superfamily [Helianthus annuus]|nr:putative P-loop containing nucleoside triphosphate hydrolase, leucine-rich repeat domain superfamily [Helianthus annuus]
MSSKLNEITTKLNALVVEKNILGLISNVEMSNRISRRLEETSLVDLSRIVGRDGDKKALLEKLLGNELCDENVSILSIVGLGGIGKTTLAQVLYNDEKVKNHFKLMSWVCVSDEFDVFNISKAIFKDVGGEDAKFETLNQLQVALTEKLINKRFLLVLDDVWSENYNEWELLLRPFVIGASGSKIILTTRKTMVASMMDSFQAYPLDHLSNEEALSLFAQHALGKPNFDSHLTLKSHGEGIVKKCGGLPLALITLGRVLRTKSNDEEWEKLLNSEIWHLQNENKILPALRLSYYDLPPHLKQMFAYCCLFPKDYVFQKDELVLLWMAEGFLYESNSNKSLESLGRECFEELESRSFFQQSTNDKSGYTMHELINDLATSVAREFFLMLGDKMALCDMKEDLGKFHHFSFIRESNGVYRKFKALHRARRLRTFIAMSITKLNTRQRFYLSNNVLLELLPKLQFLRVLSLANYNITVVPHSIGSLKHMRYLNFSNTDIICLPEQVGDLYNLQSLLVSGCPHLYSLPNSTVKLINLRHLDISDTPLMLKTPLGIAGLTSLKTLSKVIIGEEDEFKISDLKGLFHLQGQLSIEGLHKVRNAIEAKEANLQQKKSLRDLEMKWSAVFDGSHDEISEYEVFEGLRPFEKLTSLKIYYYKGTKFPSWVGDGSLVCLTQLTLHGCRYCTHLPTLGHLPSLRKLFIQRMDALKRLGPELLGPPNSCPAVAFPSLEVLEFKNMKNWEEWSTSGGEKDRIVEWFPCLHEMSIINCPKLDVVAIELIPSLRVLHIQGCSVVVLRSMVGVASSIIRLTIWDNKGLNQLHREGLEHLQAVEYLRILQCDELTYLWQSEAEACKILVSLQKLEVSGCVNLISLGEEMVTQVIGMEPFREVEIKSCPRLNSYYCPNSVEKLKISGCDSATSLTFQTMHDLPSNLKILNIEDCHNLEVNWLDTNFLLSLESLIIFKIPTLRLFHEECLVHLTTLIISGCDNIETIPGKGFGFLPFLCLRSLVIANCKTLKSFPHEQLQSLTWLEEMRISNCPRMDYPFPCGLWPPNLSTLFIGGLKKPISEWGQQNFPTSLVTLILYGKNSGVVSFAKVEDMRNSC